MPAKKRLEGRVPAKSAWKQEMLRAAGILRATAALGSAATCLLATRKLRTATVAGNSMAPTFASESTILIESVSTALGWVSRGDVVVLTSPEQGCEGMLLTKRVVAVEDDWLFARDGRLVRVPRGHVWVEGDNSKNSNDSTHYGAVSCRHLVGTVLAKVWPPAEAGALKNRRGACESRVLPRHVGCTLDLCRAEVSPTLRVALRSAFDATLAYTQAPVAAIVGSPAA